MTLEFKRIIYGFVCIFFFFFCSVPWSAILEGVKGFMAIPEIFHRCVTYHTRTRT